MTRTITQAAFWTLVAAAILVAPTLLGTAAVTLLGIR